VLSSIVYSENAVLLLVPLNTTNNTHHVFKTHVILKSYYRYHGVISGTYAGRYSGK
jgi:hypothetical protein